MSIERVVCLNCMDGRVQLPVIEWIREKYNVEFVDMITRAGIIGLLADQNYDVGSIYRSIEISQTKNKAEMIFVVGHFDCRGNPVDEETQRYQIRSAIDRLKQEFSGVEIVGVWVNEQWQAQDVVC